MNLFHFLFALLVLSVSADECKHLTKTLSLADPSVVRAASLALAESLSCDIYISTTEHKLNSTIIRKHFLLLMSARRKAIKKKTVKKKMSQPAISRKQDVPSPSAAPPWSSHDVCKDGG